MPSGAQKKVVFNQELQVRQEAFCLFFSLNTGYFCILFLIQLVATLISFQVGMMLARSPYSYAD